MLDMQKAATQAERTIAVLSPGLSELRSLPSPSGRRRSRRILLGESRTLLPVRARECKPERLAKSKSSTSILLERARSKRARGCWRGVKVGRFQTSAPSPLFPGVDQVGAQVSAFPRSALPEIWNVPHLRNPELHGPR